jgi:hypothetical protein
MEKLTFGQAFVIYSVYIALLSVCISYGLDLIFDFKPNILGTMLVSFGLQLLILPMTGRIKAK